MGDEQDRQGIPRQVPGAPWKEGENFWWFDEVGADSEQEWENCEQEGVGQREEGLREDQEVDGGLQSRKEAAQPEGLCHHRRQDCARQGGLRKGKSDLRGSRLRCDAKAANSAQLRSIDKLNLIGRGNW